MLNKQEILNKIAKFADTSVVLKGKKVNDVWTINELVYCLEMIERNCHLHLSINTDNGLYVPVEDAIPTFIDTKTRGTKVTIEDIEYEDVYNDGSYEEYLVIVKTV